MDDKPVENRKIVTIKTWTVQLTEYDDDSSTLHRTNDGFSVFELIGLTSLLQFELIQQFKGYIEPTIIKRDVII